jgi:hypothetical protein
MGPDQHSCVFAKDRICLTISSGSRKLEGFTKKSSAPKRRHSFFKTEFFDVLEGATFSIILPEK